MCRSGGGQQGSISELFIRLSRDALDSRALLSNVHYLRSRTAVSGGVTIVGFVLRTRSTQLASILGYTRGSSICSFFVNSNGRYIKVALRGIRGPVSPSKGICFPESFRCCTHKVRSVGSFTSGLSISDVALIPIPSPISAGPIHREGQGG